MIKELRIKNFQAHKDTSLMFSEGVNVIKGTSAQGKTSIVRALRWVLNNRPQGFTFKSHWATEEQNTSVEVNFDKDKHVARQRGKTTNEYINQNGEVFKALRGEVPDEIKEILQMDDVNLMSQHDSYFMLQDTPGERGRKINAVVNLGVIDEVLKKCAGLIKKTRTNIAQKEIDIATNECKLGELKHVVPSEILIKEIEIQDKQKTELTVVALRLEDIIDRLIASNEKRDKDINWLKIKPDYEEIEGYIKECKEISDRITGLTNILTPLKKSIAKRIDDEGWLKVKHDYEAILPLISTSKALYTKKDRINKLILSIEKAKTMQNSAYVAYEIKQNLYNVKLKSVGICPLCGSQT